MGVLADGAFAASTVSLKGTPYSPTPTLPLQGEGEQQAHWQFSLVSFPSGTSHTRLLSPESGERPG
jgi:hypothetical protein